MPFVPAAIDDFETLAALPAELQNLLEQQNGAMLYGGALHVRGACFLPDWHSIRQLWTGNFDLWQRFPTLRVADVPCAQDAVGDQFLWREGEVVRLRSETGDMELWGCGVDEFLNLVRADPVEVLEMAPLPQQQSEDGELLPGQLISVFRPFARPRPVGAFG